MPKPVNPLSVIRPATQIVTSARVRLMKARKHIQKLNDADLDAKLHKALKETEELEVILKKVKVAYER